MIHVEHFNRLNIKNGNTYSRKEKLLLRQKIVGTIRNYFDRQSFFEAEVPLLVSGTTPDPYIESFSIGTHYLTTSTEYHIKKLILEGFDKVYTITKNFRQYEYDVTHNPEFTMLEWARKDATLDEIDNDVINLVNEIAERLFVRDCSIVYNRKNISLRKEDWKRITFQELFETFYGIYIPEVFTLDDISKSVSKSGIKSDFCEEPLFLFSELLDSAIKKIGFDAPVLIKKWPSFLTTSAEILQDNPCWVDRTELIIAGIEVADGFPFLRNYEKQISLFEQANKTRCENNMPPVDFDKKYLEALKFGLPHGAGMALGIDRLCMLFTDSKEIRDVLCFDWEEL